ncbi:PEP-CTERM sorting domain-containing protein [Botrimarina hoheduenensis]|uniref:Ice-binding protein C-terminal domain-containing protein n=1 Tax=Botrimarina hoheduenensis TaxID=2528000 RepID=A0A5C5WBZ1_9BACT|nr:PEP-CTERM sorting domain-containing protein [Botrimarina hoheduenensis]TWT48418.1 hypothetical protein Pla111_01860 [Botrimarina hoheduenensis]
MMITALPVRAGLDARVGLLAATLSWLVAGVPAEAAQVLFNPPPFAGTTALETPGRQIVGNEVFVPDFDFAADVFAFNAAAFGIESLTHQNSMAASLPSSGVNVIVLQDTDSDANPATPFLAGTAAALIAAQIDTPTPGFFIYHNSNLAMSRLVYSTDLSETTSDLKILARLTNPTGAEAIALLPTISAANFQLVPEPASMALVATAAATLVLRRRGAGSRRA